MDRQSRLLSVLKSGTFILLSKMHSMRSSGRWAWVDLLLYLRLLLPCSPLLRLLSRTALPVISRLFFHELRSADIVPPNMLPICWQEESAHRFRCWSGTVSSIFFTSGGCPQYLSVLVKGG